MAVLSGVLPPKPATAVESDVVTPITFRVFQNYPNPFNPATVIEFALEKPADVELTIFALSGQTVRTLVSGNMPAGVHAVRWDGRDDSGKRVSSATYFYRLQTERDGAVVKKALLVK
jgi:hypothetical protein